MRVPSRRSPASPPDTSKNGWLRVTIEFDYGSSFPLTIPHHLHSGPKKTILKLALEGAQAVTSAALGAVEHFHQETLACDCVTVEKPGGGVMGFDLGQRIADYEVVSVLGTGGMGRVYQVRNVISHRIEAMKVLLADLHNEPDLAARFRSEIRTLAGLQHPNIAQLHTAIQNGNELLMIMEFVEGCTLQQLAQSEALPLETSCDYVQQVLSALSYAHGRGVIHRDIKPANIMVTPEGVIKLTDFGIAKSKAKDQLTRPGTTLGSLNYISPEQARGSCMADERSDIYSVGITLYELFTGRLPFDDESAYVVLHRQLHELPKPPIEINSQLSQPLNDLIMKALEKDPALRFQSAAELGDRLREVTGFAAATPTKRVVVAQPRSGIRVVSARIPRTAAFRPLNKRRPWRMVSAAAACMVLVALSAVGLPHLSKNIATANAVAQATAPSVTPPVNPATNPAAKPVLAATATVVAPPPPRVVAAPAPETVQPAAPKLSRAAYHPVSLPRVASTQQPDSADSEAAAAESEARPILPPRILAEVEGVRRQSETLDARASVIRSKMTRLRTQKIHDGYELDQAMADAYVNMNVNLAAENADLTSGDVAAAHGHMEKAAAEVNLLEKLFNQ